MENSVTFLEKRKNETTLKLRELRNELPMFCSEFFIGKESSTSPLTRLGYARDLKIFFDFLSKEIADFEGKDPQKFTLLDLNKVTATHIELFLDYVNYYEHDGQMRTNTETGKMRKLSTLRAFFKYFYKKDKISQNVTNKVDIPKLHNKNIIRLEPEEVSEIISISENGTQLTKNQRYFHKYTQLRDTAILSLFLGTGIRISELVGIDVDDINFQNNSFVITRKGGNEYILYFSNEVAQDLLNYYKKRMELSEKVCDEDKNAFFLSMQLKRISIRAVQNLVKKYSRIVNPLKKISPHKLRSTYGTNLYQKTQDIYIVAEVLGHKDINTTKKHYAAMSEDIRKKAANQLNLRKN